MKSVLICIFMLALLTACGSRADVAGNSGASNSTPGPPKPEKVKLDETQQAILQSGTEVTWDEQGLSWTLPGEWKKLIQSDETFSFQATDNMFLNVKVSPFGEQYSLESNLNSFYAQAQQKLNAGEYESVKLTEIAGIPGVEFVEVAPEDDRVQRRHQWIGYRTYKDQKQQINVMTSVYALGYKPNADKLTAILYSMKTK